MESAKRTETTPLPVLSTPSCPSGLEAESRHLPEDRVASRLQSKPVVRIIQIGESWGGVEHYNTQLAVRLTRLGIQVKITTIGKPAYAQMPARYAAVLHGVVEEIAGPAESDLTFLDWFRLMWSRPANVVVLSKNWWAKGGLRMVTAAGLIYRRIVLHEHVPVPANPELGRKRYLGLLPAPHLWYHRKVLYGRLLSAPADRVICVSQVMRERLIQECGYAAHKTTIVNNGADCNLFRFDEEARRRYRHTLGIPEDAVVFGAVARIQNAVKRHDLSLRLFARLIGDNSEAKLHFLLVGDGPDVEILKGLAHELHVEDRVSIAPFTSTPWEAYSALDVFLMPSRFEGFSLALVEAMACECCAIAMDVSGVAEILDKLELGWRVAVDDSENFYAAMCAVLRMGAACRREMGIRARDSVATRFNADQQYGAAIQEILGTTRRELNCN